MTAPLDLRAPAPPQETLDPATTPMTTPLRTPLNDDPLWFKDALIYEIHVRAFSDSNGDGIGDLVGLIGKLDYICNLGVTAIWLLPFYPSPLRDGGYDIADYTGIHPSYGTRRDFALLLAEAHKRGLRVITELVLNHTSNEHPWFQRARRAPPGSPEREVYVWSDTPAPYEDARIIFTDFETSNWAWDPVAKAYFWHRFYSHQPDLNFRNPAVKKAMLEVVDFWLDMGVDGLRLDAVPYLYEREGTSCENLPETHAFLKELRAHIDGKYKNRMLLAEANQWPADAAAYFGDGDECQMNFHFPLMPRMFISIELEDSFPIVNTLENTPPVPETCQWATFLRNHDELTLEMVTDEDREMMYRAYASEHSARVNLGIRRRLAPLLKVRRKIELMNALLLSLPGTPVLYYGDEIGMGDNIYLGDRDGVRTPMQWSADRNAGFSKANPQKLYLPIIIDPEYHYEAINVEAQQANPSSLLWWMKRILAKRKEYKLFGRGTLTFLHPENARVLAFVRELEGKAMLVVANLSRFAQCVHLDLWRFEGIAPTEVFGRTRFPVIGRTPYFLSLGPHGFFWLDLERKPAATVADSAGEPQRFDVSRSWTAVLDPSARPAMASLLAEYLALQRWFRGKARVRKGASIVDVLWMGEGDSASAIVLLLVEYDSGVPETYVMPVAFVADGEASELGSAPHATIARVIVHESASRGGQELPGTLCDAMVIPRFATSILRQILDEQVTQGEHGQLAGVPASTARAVPADAHLAPRALAAEQSNSSVVYGTSLLFKLFRAIEEGPHPEDELGRFLAGGDFTHASRLTGGIEYRRPSAEPALLGSLMELTPSQGDAWRLSVDSVARFYERVLSDTARPAAPPGLTGTLLERVQAAPAPAIAAWVGPYLGQARLLGQRTAELHRALARSTDDPAFTPEPFNAMYQQSLYQSAHEHLARTFDQMARVAQRLEPRAREAVEAVLGREDAIDRRLREVARHRIEVDRIRVHGDLHLGQVLWTGDDFVFIDFEGEPARSLAQRRFKRCPLRDVASMIRSFHYAAAWSSRPGRLRPEDAPTLAPWADAWAEWASAAYLAGYLERAAGASFVPEAPPDVALLLDFYLLEKCVYELGYELNNRPEWLQIPTGALMKMIAPVA